MSDLGLQRLAWHEAEAAARDERFTGWASAKALAAWNGNSIHAFTDRALVVAVTGWDECSCGRPFQPIPPKSPDRWYATCFRCNQISYADGVVTCIFCQRRHGSAYPTCASCKTKVPNAEDEAAHKRSVIMRRDAFACSMCGTEEGSMQVDRIDPGTSAFWWDLQTLCTDCQLVKGKQYGPLDELARIELMLAYDGRLAEFLFPDERVNLKIQMDEVLRAVEHPATMKAWLYGACEDDLEGMLDIARAFRPTDTSHMDKSVSLVQIQEKIAEHDLPLTELCHGEVLLSTGRRPCRNKISPKYGSICTPGPCR